MLCFFVVVSSIKFPKLVPFLVALALSKLYILPVPSIIFQVSCISVYQQIVFAIM